MTLLAKAPEDRTLAAPIASLAHRRAEAARSFAYSPTAARMISAFHGRSTIVRLDTVDNAVLGVPRWVAFGDLWSHPGMRGPGHWRDNPVIEVAEGDDPRLVLATGTPVVLFGVDNHLHRYARAVIDHLRSTCRTVLVVDMGVALRDLAYADIATFGYDEERGAALIDLLTTERAAA